MDCAVYPMTSKGGAPHPIELYEYTWSSQFYDIGWSQQYNSRRVLKKAQEAGIHCKAVKPYSPWSNLADASIRKLKGGTRCAMLKGSSAPKDLLSARSDLLKYCPWFLPTWIRSPIHVDGQWYLDISAIFKYGWYEWTYYQEEKAFFIGPPAKGVWILYVYVVLSRLFTRVQSSSTWSQSFKTNQAGDIQI